VIRKSEFVAKTQLILTKFQNILYFKVFILKKMRDVKLYQTLENKESTFTFCYFFSTSFGTPLCLEI